MTNVDLVLHLGKLPNEASVAALTHLREVYGIRAVKLSERERTVRIEYDATRLAEPTVRQFARRAGLDIVDAPASLEAATL